MPTEKIEKSSFGVAALLIAAWSAILLIAFFADRGGDVGRIGQLFGNLGSGPLFGWDGLRDSLLGGLIALLILIAWFGLGSLITRFIPRERNAEHSHVLEIVINVAVGAAAWSLIFFFLGVVGAYSATTGILSIAAGIVFAVVGFGRVRGMRGESRTPEKPGGIDLFLLILIAIPIVLALIASMAPPTAKDTLLYHFALPKAFVAHGSNEFISGNIASYLALGGEMHNVWAMLLGRLVDQRTAEATAGAVNWLFFPLLLAVVFGWSRELGISRRLSLLAVVIVASVPSVYHVSASSYIDVQLAMFVTLAIYSLARWWRTLGFGWLILIAIFLGAALSIKLTSVVAIAAFALVMAFRARNADNAGRILGYGLAALVVAGVIASPWYLRTWKATGSPVFPFYMSIWKGEAAGWDVDRSNLFQAMNANYGGENKSAVDYLIAPWNVSVTAQPEEARYFDGVLGVAFLLGLPLLIWALWKLEMPVEAKIGVAVAAVMYLFWLFSSQQLRYLLPVVPVMAIAVVAAVRQAFDRDDIGRSVAELSLAAASVAAMLVSVAWFLQKAPLRVVLGGETRDAYLTRNLDYFPYYQYLNTESPADARIWLINMRRDTYNLERPAVSDYLFEDWTLRQMLWESRSLQELKAKAAATGTQYILTRHDFLFDYDHSSLVDDKRSRAENEAKLKMARDLILDPARTVKQDERFSLVKVF
jgi:hypothetical protein